MLVGVISDTHRHLPDVVHDVFARVDHIIHAGDVGSERVLDGLAVIAPVTAVSGNDDSGVLARRLPGVIELDLGGFRILVGHKRVDLEERCGDGCDVVVSGHTHAPCIESVNGVLFLNPGTAGRDPRGDRGATVALLELTARCATARIVEL